MRTKVLILTIIGLGVVSLWTVSKFQHDVTKPQSTTTITAENSVTDLKSKNNTSNKARGPKYSKPENSKNKVMAEIEPRLFSDDAYVELLSLKLTFGLCNETQDATDIFGIWGEIHQKQLELVDQLLLSCEQFAGRYPLTFKAIQSKEWLSAVMPQSQLGQLLKNKHQNHDINELYKQNQRILEASLINGNSALIIHANQINRFGKTGLSQFSALIDSIDSRYIHHVNQVAVNLIACRYQNGLVCQSTLGLMFSICARFPAACGLDFQQWYQQNTLPGMQKDVEKLMAYYQQSTL